MSIWSSRSLKVQEFKMLAPKSECFFSQNQLKKMKEYYLNSNTDICVDVKTVLHSSKTAKTGKDYQGVLTRDNDDHYTFIETIPPATGRRNPQVFNGKFVTITRMSDGTYRPNFKPVKIGANFNVKAYALCVYLELNKALKGLVEVEVN